MADRAGFHADRLDDFWRFIAERQRTWCRRTLLGRDPPWSDDEHLRRHRFTNVYRILDPGTQYAIRAILAGDAPARDRLFNDLVYRLVGRDETHETVGFQRLDTFDPDDFEAALRAREDAGEPVFTGAYTVSGYGWMGGSDKVENVARLFTDVRDGFDEFYAEVEAAERPEDVYDAVLDLPGFGNFLAYQVLVDLLYPAPTLDGESFLPFSPDKWAAAGPGAKRGLELLTTSEADCTDLEAMRWLWRNQEGAFDRLGPDFAWLRDAGGNRIELSLPDVQNCCCEFYKYHKVRTGRGRTRRRFDPADARSAEELRALYAAYGISVDEGDYESDVEEET